VAVAALVGGGSPAASAACPNEEFRSGPSADLPDCRAYELVTPPTLNRIFYAGTGNGAGTVKFNYTPVAPSGDGYLWTAFSTGAPGTPSTGASNLLEAERTSNAWIQKFLSPIAQQAEISGPGSADFTHKYVTFEVETARGGSLTGCSCSLSSWVRYPDGSFHAVGEGTLPTETDTDGYENGLIDDPDASAVWMAPNGSHRVFEANVALTLGAPSNNQVYDRTPTGLNLVSILPGEDPPVSDSLFAGSSADGSVVLFKNGGIEIVSEGDLFARIDNTETVKIASRTDGEIIAGGVSADGSRVFFVQQGDISYYDVEAKDVKEVVSSGDAVMSYASPDGSHVYFLSEEQLISGQGTPAAPNLYVWDGTSIKFIGTVTAEDVSHSENNGFAPFVGLGLWATVEPIPVAQNKNFLTASARTTFDGTVFIFESRAKLTDYPNEGHAEIYRYEPESEDLLCVSCSPVEPASSADSNLVFLRNEGALKTLQKSTEIANLSADGSSVVFESKGPLLPADTNGVRDVYQWREGTLSIISTGHASLPAALIGVSSSGSDIFFQTAEQLVPQGQTPGSYAIYDARVNGGLASQQIRSSLECEGEGCLGMPSAAPGLAAPGSSQLHGKGNVKKRCHGRRGKKRHKHHGKRGHARKKSCTSKGRRASK